ncbi:putative lincosamide nucleotidyltransferase [Ilumatobacter coccineus YM16-304]|uniref:Putative lincosamide nucleotidyltransferase n=2 Tax=Ilumatobacter coccineus TaxID=467094 RepID=A0A6C7DZW2_ILUCY|nr:putative lincosamide nucleotidyltransferase [Ilumatobacter coccineus YM16-304]
MAAICSRNARGSSHAECVLLAAMPTHVMDAGDAVLLLAALSAKRVDACVGGGWAVDALLGEQTREHSDLDLWIPASSLHRAVAVFAERGVDRLFPVGDERPWNFVLHDGAHVRVDLHLYETLATGELHYGGVESGETFPADALSGTGTIGVAAVRCEAPEWSVQWHTGYDPRPVDRHDVPRLCSKFGLELPPALR